MPYYTFCSVLCSILETNKCLIVNYLAAKTVKERRKLFYFTRSCNASRDLEIGV